MEVHELLTKALEELEKYGWVPRGGMPMGYKNAPLCVWGAITAAARAAGARDHMRTKMALAFMAATETGRGWEDVGLWNDKQTSFAPVKAAFCRAIEATSPVSQETETASPRGVVTTTPKEDQHERLQTEAPRARDAVGVGAPG